MTATATETPVDATDRFIMHTYARQPVTLVRGLGMYVWDDNGKRYLDFLGGIAVNGVGHCHPKVVAAIREQAGTLMHASNLYNTVPMQRLSEALVRTTGGDFDKVFFCNSGTEAVEAAIKIARKHGKQQRPDSSVANCDGSGKTKVVSVTGSFHGRTFGALAATAQPKYQTPFAPMVPDFVYAERNDLDSLQACVDENTCAVIVEPIQGESGVHPADRNFLKYARTLCDKYGALLIFDEIQCGMGRTGSWWAYRQMDVVPDVMTAAKALGGGLPIGAVLARGAAAETLVPGDHGSTFAGNPVTASAALAVIDVIESEGLMHNAAEVGDYLRRKLTCDLSGRISEVRGAGLMIGVELQQPIAKKIVADALSRGLIVNATGDTTLRLLPPLIVTREQVDEAVEIMQATMTDDSLPT